MALNDVEICTYRDNQKDAAIVFIHGFFGDLEKTWGNFPEFLKTDNRLKDWDVFSIGYPTNLSIDIPGLWSAYPDLSTLAQSLLTQLNHLKLRNYKTYTFIAHSMGGLVLQKALIDENMKSEKIYSAFLFGTPSNGLKKAFWVRLFNRQLRDMSVNRKFILELRKEWDERWGKDADLPFKFLAIAGERDEFVPAKSSIKPFPKKYQAVVYGNHLEIVKPETINSKSVQIVINAMTGEAAYSGPWNSARVAVELGDFKKAIKLFSPHVDELDQPALVQYALALEQTGRQTEAIEVLQKYSKDKTETDAMGVLAGRFKRRWLSVHRKKDADKALELYTEALEISKKEKNYSQCYYHGINVAFMEFAYQKDYKKVEKRAEEVLTYCRLDNSSPDNEKWKLATIGEAYLYKKNYFEALEHYKNALKADPTARECSSMYQQAIWICELIRNQNIKEKFDTLFNKKC